MKNWIFNGKGHRIRKTSQNRWSLFRKILQCWRRDSKEHFLKFRKYLKIWFQLGHNLWKIEYLMKRCIGYAKLHRTVVRVFARYYNAEEVIHKRISWNWENISKSGPKLGPKLCKIESLMKRCIGYAKLHRTVVRFFARYYNAEEVIHKRISWNWENISKSGTRVRPKIMKNWIFNEKVHRIRKTFTEPLFAFSQDITMLKKWFISAFPEIEKISQNLVPIRP